MIGDAFVFDGVAHPFNFAAKNAYGSAGRVTFRTLGRGVLGAAPVSGAQRGAVVWEITGGEGRLAGAQGLITSNFVVGADGGVTDDQFARLYVPD